MRLERVSRASASVTIAEIKAYANITTSDDDALLTRLLNSALTRVEDISNISLAANTIKLYSERVSTSERLFIQPVASVTSVIEVENGESLDFTLYTDKSRVKYPESEVVITYVTSAAVNDELKQLVIELASAMYDGQDKAVIEGILQKIPRL